MSYFLKFKIFFGKIVLAILIASAAQAEVPMFASLYNKAKYGFTCQNVKKADLKKNGFNCAHGGNRIEDLSLPAWEMYEWNIFNLAAQNQIDKNKCLAERLKCIEAQDQSFDRWSGELVSTWLGLQKSKLILQKCKNEVFYKIDPANEKRYGIEKALEMAQKNTMTGVSRQLSPEWKKVCFNKETIASLKMAEELFGIASSAVNDPQTMKDMESLRHKIVWHTTGKPLTNDALLRMDLSDLSQIRLIDDAEFKSVLKPNLSRLADERLQINRKLKKGIDSKVTLDGDLKEYIYKDGTLVSTMTSMGEMSAPVSTLDQAQLKSEPKNSDASKVEVSDAAMCVLTNFEQTPIGELIDFAAKSTLWSLTMARGLAEVAPRFYQSVVLKRPWIAIAAKPLKPLRTCVTSGPGGIGCYIVMEQIEKACISQSNQAAKIRRASDGESSKRRAALDLPKEIDYTRFSMNIDPKCTPSCTSEMERRLMVNSEYSVNCLVDGLVNATPLRYSLPAMILAK